MFDVEALDPVVGDVLGRYAALVDEMCTVPVTALSDGDLLALVQGMETQRRRRPVAEHRVIAEVESRGVAGLAGYASTATLLGLLLRLDPGDARARVSAAADLALRLGVSGEPVGAERGLLGQAVSMITEWLGRLRRGWVTPAWLGDPGMAG